MIATFPAALPVSISLETQVVSPVVLPSHYYLGIDYVTTGPFWWEIQNFFSA